VNASRLLLILLSATLCACTTLENRRYLFTEERVEGPYTRMVDESRWPWTSLAGSEADR
jgi:hypothetical protein